VAGTKFLKMSLLKKYEKLEKKADKYYEMHDSECNKMFDLIKPMLQFPMPYEGQTVFLQTDGYVLLTPELEAKNTPVRNIINWFEKTGQLVDEDILYTLSI